MKSRIRTQTLADDSAEPRGVFRSLVLRRLEGLSGGTIEISEDGARTRIGKAGAGEPAFRITVHDPAFYRFVALEGGTGAGEAYIEGMWDCDNLVGLLCLLARNRDLLAGLDGGIGRLARPLLRAWHRRNRNTRAGSARNIAAHYDLGNDLFRLFLDEGMMYSSAVYESADMSLEAAQTAKLDRICAKLGLSAHHRVLEIGTGWGGFAIHAARRFGCHVTTTTISHEQCRLAREKVAEAGLADYVEVLERDYRDLSGRFDRIVSIEMIEAVGHEFLEEFFAVCRRHLADDGAMLIQAITIEDHRYEQALNRVDFIKRFVFPGSFIPSLSALLGSAARASDLKLIHMEDIGPSYARTLAEWTNRFAAARQQVLDLGYPEAFIRLWHFYLAYCEAGFRERAIGDAQLLFAAPGHRGAAPLPAWRALR